MNWIKEKIDSYYFKRFIVKKRLGLRPDDIEWMVEHGARIKRIAENMKANILQQTLHSLTIRDHQRKKDWHDCLTALQELCKTTNKEGQIDYLRMKPIEKEKPKNN